MAWVTGTAANHRDLLRRLVDFLTTNTDLVAVSQQWQILRGYLDMNVDYVQNTAYIATTDYSFDASVALGLDDTSATPSGLAQYGWADVSTNLPTGYLGVKFSTAKTPTSYKIRSREWTGTNLGAQAPKDWDVEYSDDGTTWTTAEQVRGATAWGNGETRTYTIGSYGAHTYWRVRPLANNGDTYTVIGRLRFYDSGNAWISRGYTPEYVVKGLGLTGSESIMLGMRLHESVTSDWYTLRVNGQLSHDATAQLISQPYYQPSYIALWNQPMTYWFIGNGQRVIVVAKVSTTYSMSYFGKYLPYALPGQYPNPLIISAPVDTVSKRWSDTTVYNRSIQSPSYGSFIMGPGNQWAPIQNRYNSSTDSPRGENEVGYAFVLPTMNGSTADPAAQSAAFISQNPDGSYNLQPCVLVAANLFGGTQVFGELDGVNWVTGNNNASENIIAISGQNHMVVQNVFRTGSSDYCTVELK